MTQRTPNKISALRIGGAATGLSGSAVALITNSPPSRAIGIALIFGGAFLIWLSRRWERSCRNNKSLEDENHNGTRPFQRLVWIITTVSLISTVIFFWFMYQDAQAGYRHVWLLYLFAASAQIFLIASVCIGGAFIWKIFSRKN
jgi:hypothetical protein